MNVSWIKLMGFGFVLAVAAGCSSGASEGRVDTKATEELVASLKARSLPGLPDPLTPEKAVELEKLRTGPGGFFVQKGCFACHDVSVYGIKSGASVGPDLSIAVDDVRSRFGMSLEDFFAAPVGTMSVVLTQMIPLSPEEKGQAMEHLRAAHREFEKQKAAKDDRPQEGEHERKGGDR
jgi:hypothetical protein